MCIRMTTLIHEISEFTEVGEAVDLDVMPDTLATNVDGTLIAKEGERFDVLKESRAAFEEISGIYGSGLGDQEVRILAAGLSVDDAIGARTKKVNNITPQATEKAKGTFTIEEGDEEEEEEDCEDEKQVVFANVESSQRPYVSTESSDVAEFGADWEVNKQASVASSTVLQEIYDMSDFQSVSCYEAESYFKC